jgi:Concanavalin A-like lectin/glucanases superfamily
MKHWVLLLLALCCAPVWGAGNEGLLFYQSFDTSLVAEVAQGDVTPNFADKITLVPGKYGKALSTADDNVLTWNAPGNIYAKRGTVSFFWRARTPLGRAPFVLFRVGYADHSSWDMVWLRMDYNGHGYDAFVTDNNLARIRVSFTLEQLPLPDVWTHLAFTWDETKGVTLYVNGKAVAGKAQTAVLDAGLDQFGMAARAVSPHQVQSRYNFMRGSDYDELRIYDHMLTASEIASLSRNEPIQVTAQPPSDLNTPETKAEWNWRYGWNRKGDMSQELTAPVTSIRKLEFADAKDIKQWMFKATDGIAETTWPGVYNRSRLPGRLDYFPLPDWNTYVEGGKTLTLTLPQEPWNRIDIQGAAYGSLTYALDDKAAPATIASRAENQERTFHSFAQTRVGGVLRFNNIAQETPIQEIWAYNITAGDVPKGTASQSYTIRADAAPDSPDLDELNAFISKRYSPDERATVVALPDAAPARPRVSGAAHKLPLVHILIPYEYGASPPSLPLYRSWGYGWENMHEGLDGIALSLPALHVTPGADGLIALNIQVKDPIWPERNMMDIAVSVKPNTPRTLWLDLRDRILPHKSLYLSIASASADFSATSLDGAKLKLIFKDRAEALKEHITDRFNQVKDNWGYLVEEHTASKREKLYARLVADMTDLLRVAPDNKLALEYWNDITYRSQQPLAYEQPKPPANVPLWAFRQLEDLKYVRHYINWWIDNRQSDYGDFGGGLSDDSDLVEQWPGVALMGVDSEKMRVSQMRVADAIYKNGMFTNGLSTLMLDELHAYEDGINTNSEAMYINYGNPKVVERLMTTVDAYKRIISVNAAGHLHFNTNWFSGTDSYREGPFEWGKFYSYNVLHPGLLLAEYNGDATGRMNVLGLADGILAHGKQDAAGRWSFPDEINWRSDAVRGNLPAGSAPMHLFWAAYKWTGDDKYLRPLIASVEKGNSEDSVSVGGARVVAEKGNIRALTNMNEDIINLIGKQSTWGDWAVKRAENGTAGNLERYEAWEMTGDKKYLEALYGAEMAKAATTMYSQTEGHWWVDRVDVDSQYLQRTRLGGTALTRGNIEPGATVSWAFPQAEDALKLAILIRKPAREHFTVEAFNTSDHDIVAQMTGWNVAAGVWEMRGGVADAQVALPVESQPVQLQLEKTTSTTLHFSPGKTMLYQFTRKSAGDAVESRPDIGIGEEDVDMRGRNLHVTVHSLGAKPAPVGVVQLIGAHGELLATTPTPPLPAPSDMQPHTARVTLPLPKGFVPKGAHVHILIPHVQEITQMNNDVELH